MYRKMIASEVCRTTEQWNRLKIALRRPHEFDFPKALIRLALGRSEKVLKEIWHFVMLSNTESKWRRNITLASIQRLLLGDYISRQWLS